MAGNRSRRPNASGFVDPAKVDIAPGTGVVAPPGTAAPMMKQESLDVLIALDFPREVFRFQPA